MSKTAIVILNWNGWQDTIALLGSLMNATYDPLLVIIIDNASSDKSIVTIEQYLVESQSPHTVIAWETGATENNMSHALSKSWEAGKHFLFVKSDTNLGFCAGNNLGMEWATRLGADNILILNNDTLVTADFLQPMVEVAESAPDVGLVGGLITYCDEPDIIWWAGGAFNRFLKAKRLLDKKSISTLTEQAPYETEWISGCMTMIPTHIYKKFGGYPEEYFIWGEEWDYSVMVARAGYKLMVVPNAKICHKVGRSLGIMKPLNYYYGLRNHLLFQHKYLPYYLWYPYFFYYLLNRLVRFTHLLFQGRSDLVSAGWSAIRDYLFGQTGKWRHQKI